MAFLLRIPFQFGIHAAVIVAIACEIRLTDPKPVNQVAGTEGQHGRDHSH